MTKAFGRRGCFQRGMLVAAALTLALGTETGRAGRIDVNSTADGPPQNDATITLREALQIARGDRVPFNHPDPDEPDEVSLVSTPFGAGVEDMIGLPGGPATIALIDYLPPLSDTTDGIIGGSDVAIDGSGLAAQPTSFGLLITGNGHSTAGLTIRGFPGDGVRILGANNRIFGMIITNNAGAGLVLSAAETTMNEISNCIIRNNNDPAAAVLITNGASANLLTNVFVYGNAAAGLLISGAGTNGNLIRASAFGVTEPFGTAPYAPSMNGGYGVVIRNGAQNNGIGAVPPGGGQVTIVSNNQNGGVLITDAGTEGNFLDHVWVGFDNIVPRGAPNGDGHGVTIRDGAKNNTIGQPGTTRNVIISGQRSNGILITGVGTTGNSIQNTFVGGPNPFTAPGLMINDGHGIEVADGAGEMFIGGLDEALRLGVTIDHTGPDKHGVFLNGSNAGTPIRNVNLGFYHFGNERMTTGQPSIGGDAIRVTGTVQDLVIGGPGHRNHSNGAAGYGIRLEGPDVRNVTLNQVYAGVYLDDQSSTNSLGGILITDGVQNVTISGAAGTTSRSYIGGNNGPGLTIDARSRAPSQITIQNAHFGLGDTGAAVPNVGDDILIEGAAGTSPTALTGIRIGNPTAEDLRNVISGSRQNGIHLKNVSRVEIYGNRIGTDPTGLFLRPNQGSGLLLEGCADIDVGGALQTFGGNLISGNAKAGIRFTDRTRDVRVHQNLIGLNRDGDEALPNGEAGILIEPPGPPTGSSLVIGGGSDFAANFPVDPQLLEGNVISGNGGPGILLKAPQGSNGQIERVSIQGNLIGTRPDGKTALPGGGPGVRVEGPNVVGAVVGHASMADRVNIISGNRTTGIEVDGAVDWKIWGNVIGLDYTRMMIAQNGTYGVSLVKTTQGELGSTNPTTARNLISGNVVAGLHIGGGVGGTVRIVNNRIGTNAAGDMARPNGFGVVIEPGSEPSPASRLVLGGDNPSIGVGGASLGAGNLISGNVVVGVRIGKPGEPGGEVDGRTIDLLGNYIGVAANGNDPLPNLVGGVEVTEARFPRVNIGLRGAPMSGNVISANEDDGVLIANGSRNVQVASNLIGAGANLNFGNPTARTDPRPSAMLPNTGHGIRISGGSTGNVVAENFIFFNRLNGVRIEGEMTQRNRITRNSIHRNEKKGIAVVDGANGGIEPPRFLYAYRPSLRANQMNGKIAVPGGLIEIFTDEPPEGNDAGYWGQGRNFIRQAAPIGRDFTVALGSTLSGIVTATVTDANLNTSEFSPIAEGLVLQTVLNDPPLLMANKPTVVRVYTGTGAGSRSIANLTGTADVGAIAGVVPMPPTHTARPYGAFFAGGGIQPRRRADDSLNFYFHAPPSGMQPVKAELFQGDRQRAELDFGNFHFQTGLTPERLVILPLSVGFTGPNQNLILAGVRYFAAVYPIESQTFTIGILPIIGSRLSPSNTVFVETILLSFAGYRSRTTLQGVVPDHMAVYMSGTVWTASAEGLSVPNAGVRSVILRDSVGASHTGPVLAHELAHISPYNLGDTYTGLGSSSSSRNPVFTTGPRFNSRETGNLVIEEDFGFNPAGVISFGQFPNPGPAANIGVFLPEFMGSNATRAWIDAPTNRLLFEALGGQVGPQSLAAPRRSDLADPALVVLGSIDTSETVTLLPIQSIGSAVPRNSPPNVQQPPYTVELRDQTGTVLDQVPWAPFSSALEDRAAFHRRDLVPFGLTPPEQPLPFTPFEIVLQDQPQGVIVTVSKGDKIVAMRAKSPTAPTVTLLMPHGPGDFATEPVLVTWMGADLDGDELFFDVLYTPDDGMTVLPLATDLHDTFTLSVSAAGLPGGGPARFIVRANDGWNIAEDASDPPFTVGDRLPTVMIARPGSGERFFEARPIGLLGSALDPEDGFLMGEALTWHLDDVTTPPLAIGMEPVVMIPEGQHTLRLTARDSFGHVVSDQVPIEIVPAPLSSLDILDYLLGLIPAGTPPAGADVNNDGTIDMADFLAQQRLEQQELGP